jgi:t-SNARE complex subunit (syntaxin)
MDIELAKKEKQIMQVNLELAVDTMCKSVEKNVSTQMSKLTSQLDDISSQTHRLDSKIKFQREIEESMNEIHESFTKSLKDLESQVISTNDYAKVKEEEMVDVYSKLHKVPD